MPWPEPPLAHLFFCFCFGFVCVYETVLLLPQRSSLCIKITDPRSFTICFRPHLFIYLSIFLLIYLYYWISLLVWCCDKTSRVYSIYTSVLQAVTQGSWGKNLGIDMETRQEHCLSACSQAQAQLSSICVSQDHVPRGSTAHSGLGSPTSVNNQ